MINNRIEELFEAIKNSKEYKDYLNIGDVLEKDSEIKELVKEIKSLQKQSVNLEYKGDISYKDIDQKIDEKVKLLNDKPIYQEYLRRMNKFNDILSESSSNIEKYINEKV